MTDFEILTNKLEMLCLKHNLPMPAEFYMCNRLKTSAGMFRWDNDKLWGGRISLANNNLEEFGLESMTGTLIHEFAHYYLFMKYRNKEEAIEDWKPLNKLLGHTTEFKRLCYQWGGTMNPQMAGEQYASAADDNFCKHQPKKKKVQSIKPFKWQYECVNCGTVLKKTRRRLSDRERKNKTCNTCRAPFISALAKEIK